MANEDSTAEVQTSGIKGVCDTTNIMMELWDRAAPTLTKEELKWFSGADDLADCATISLQKTVIGIGCLVNEDESGGNFQSIEEVPDLLFHIAHSLDQIRTLYGIARNADSRLKHFEEYRGLDEIKSVK
jgi:hypothetical protein